MLLRLLNPIRYAAVVLPGHQVWETLEQWFPKWVPSSSSSSSTGNVREQHYRPHRPPESEPLGQGWQSVLTRCPGDSEAGTCSIHQAKGFQP